MLRGVNLSQALVVLRITLAMKVSSYWLMKPSRTALGGHPKPASRGHLKTGQL
jgi:hypothetical protein